MQKCNKAFIALKHKLSASIGIAMINLLLRKSVGKSQTQSLLLLHTGLVGLHILKEN
jgi:hypothetical protein